MAPSVVQVSDPTGLFTNGVAAGNSIILIVEAYNFANSTITSSAPTLGGSAFGGTSTDLLDVPSGFSTGSGVVYGGVWKLAGITAGQAGQKQLGITLGGSGTQYALWGIEVADPNPQVDVAAVSGASGNGTNPTAGPTAPITQSDLVVGFGVELSVTLPAPTGGWTTLTPGSSSFGWCGYQSGSAPSTFTWAQNSSGGSNAWSAGIVTLASSVTPTGEPASDIPWQFLPAAAPGEPFTPWLPWPDGTAMTTAAVTLTEAASGADSLAVAGAAALSDTGSGADALTVTASVPLAETGSAADALSVTAPVALAETGAAADALAVATAITLADAASAADSLTVAGTAALADAAAAADVLAVTAQAALADAASAADTMTAGIATPLAEAASGADTLAVTSVTAVLPESGSAAATLTVAVAVALADTGSAADAMTASPVAQFMVGMLTAADKAFASLTAEDDSG